MSQSMTEEQVAGVKSILDKIDTDSDGKPKSKCDEVYFENFVSLDQFRAAWRTQFDDSNEVNFKTAAKKSTQTPTAK